MTFNDMILKQKAGTLNMVAKSYTEEEIDRLSDEFKEKITKSFSEKFGTDGPNPWTKIDWSFSSASITDYHGTPYAYVYIDLLCQTEHFEYLYEKEAPLTTVDDIVAEFTDDAYYEYRKEFEREFGYEL